MNKKLSKRDEKILQITFAESELKKQGISGFVELKYDDKIYIGQVKVDLNTKKEIPNGVGFIVWNDGSHYEGEFLNGKQHGTGEFESTSGKITKGIWKNGDFLK